MSFTSLKAHASRTALLTLVLAVILPPAAAQARAGSPVFAPVAGWEVNAGQLSSVRGLKAMKLPCVLSAEYDNGFVVRFSGGDGQMMALAIDFRQDVFMQGRQYDAMISVDTGYVKQVKATAFTRSTLIFNLRPLPDFYNAAQKGGELELEVEGNVLRFSLGRIAASYPGLESCYADGVADPVKPLTTQTASRAPVSAVERSPVDENNTGLSAKEQVTPTEQIAAKDLPRSFDDIVREADKDEADVARPAPARVPAAPSVAARAAAAPVEISAVPVAGQGMMPMPQTDVASRSHASITPPADRVSRAGFGTGYKPSTSRSNSVSRVVPDMAQPAAATVRASEAAPVPALASAPASVPVPAPAAPDAPSGQASSVAPAPLVVAGGSWTAKAGEDLKIVLSRWSERAGYDLQWQSNQDGKVAQDLDIAGRFEDAVAQLLAENSAATGIGAHVETLQGGKREIGTRVSRANSAPASVPQGPASSRPTVQAKIPAMHEEWVAAPGSNIQSILDQWSSKAGVAIVWQSYMSVPVKAPVRLSGTYEQAVQSLLDQYLDDPRRPVGQLNVDPDTGTKTLLMDVAG